MGWSECFISTWIKATTSLLSELIFSFDAKENVRNIPDNIENATIPYPYTDELAGPSVPSFVGLVPNANFITRPTNVMTPFTMKLKFFSSSTNLRISSIFYICREIISIIYV